MRIRNVVTSFVIRECDVDNSQDDGVKLLLLKRSNKVGTYQGKWAGISGSIEEKDVSPLERAYTEIQEETGLCPNDITLVIEGLEMVVEDEELDTEWHIYPFLFKMNNAYILSITLDFEHSTYKWIKPQDLSKFETVPQLPETFARVNLPRNAITLISKLHTDREMGANEMSELALQVLIYAAQEQRADFNRLRLAAYYVVQSRPSMKAAIESSLARVLTNIRKRIVTESDLVCVTKQEFENEQKNRSLHIEKYLLAFKSCLDGYEMMHILTLSYSSTTAAILNAWLPKITDDLRVQITVLGKCDISEATKIVESRPLFEGVKLANKLSLNLPKNACIEIASDACVGIFAQKATHIFIGADRISADGSVLNKVGSSAAAILGKKYGAKVVVVSGRDKIVEHRIEENEENEAGEMTEAWECKLLAGIQVRNRYFEWVDPEFIDVYITEAGQCTQRDIYESWIEKREQISVFNHL